ncbi:folylpolyglutamate synthase [Tulasnella sp. UAMH 9824]|nr:folylpolyglutamate synthase [Tulasnella sp. UAMH 9824]
MDLSLSRIHSLTSLLPRYTRPTIHVAGTNGKGSTTAFLDSILRQAGFFTGRFNSPHLVNIRDSILLGGQTISTDDYQEAFQSVTTANQVGAYQCTSFELQTATALLAFERSRVDIAILEVGLGGRLDATNVIPDDVVLVSGITAVDLDHQAILGTTLELIAMEKGGIARRNRPCVLGHQSHQEVVDTIKRSVAAVGGHLLHATEQVRISPCQPPVSTPFLLPPPPINIDIRFRGAKTYATLGIQGRHQVHNAGLAVALVEALEQTPQFQSVTSEQIAQGLSLATWPGRLSWIEYRESMERKESLWLIADGAHNAASAASLADYLSSLPVPNPRSFVISVSYSPSKSPRSTLEALLLPGDRVAVVSFSPVEGMPWVKPQEPAALARAAKDLVGTLGEVVECDSLRTALSWAGHGHRVTIITGSLYLIADLYRLLPISLAEQIEGAT